MLEVNGVTKAYVTGSERHTVLHHVSFELRTGEFAAVSGPSGSGKTTLLNILGLLDQPDAGEIHLDGMPLHGMDLRRKETIRRHDIGFLFQDFALLPTLTARENVEMAILMDHPCGMRRRLRANAALASVGIQELAERFPSELSAGQKQRVGVARALVKQPKLVLADEPTANLDAASAANLIDIMDGLVSHSGVTLLVATHDQRLLAAAGRRFVLNGGHLVPESQ